MPNLRIDIEARFAQFLDSLDSIERNAKKVGGAIAGAFLVEHVKSTVQEIIHAAAALDDMAERTGASVEGLSRLTQIAQIGGLEIGQVETALVRLTKALSGADDESKGAGKALAALGLTFEQLRGMAPEKALELVAASLNKFEDGMGKTSIAIALLGRAGADSLPLLKDIANTQGIVARVTAEQAAQAEAAEKAWARFRLETGYAAQALTLQFVPALTRSLEELAEGTRIFGGFWSALNNIASVNPFQNTQSALRSMDADLQKLIAQRDKLKAWDAGDPALAGINTNIATLQKQIEFYKSKAQRDALVGASALGDTSGEKRFGNPLAKRVAPVIQPDAKISGAGRSVAVFDESAMRVAFLRQNVHLLDQDIAETNKLYAAWISNVELIVGPLTRQADALELANKVYGQTPSEVARATAAQVEEAAVLAELGGAYDSQIRLLTDVASAYRRIADESDKAKINAALAETATGKLRAQRKEMEFFDEALARGQISATERAEIFASKFENNAKQAKTAAEEFGLVLVSEAERSVAHWQGFANLMRAIGNDLKQMAARKLITEPLANLITSVFGGSSSSGASGGGLSSSGATGPQLGSSLLSIGSSLTGAGSALTGGIQAFGAGLGLTSSEAAAAAAAYSAAGLSGTAGAISAGSAIGGGSAIGSAAGGALSTIAAAAPYVAAVIAIASLFMGKGGGPKTEGSFDSKNIERFFTSSNSDAQAKDFVDNLNKSYIDMAKKLGGVARDDLRLAFGYALDPRGTAPNAAHLVVGAAQFIKDEGRPDDFAAQAKEYMDRGLLEALKETDLYDAIDEMLAAFDPFSATSAQVTSEMQAIDDAFKQITAAGEEYRNTMTSIADAMTSVQNMFADSIRNIQYGSKDDAGKYAMLDAEAQRYRDVLNSLSDPTLIQDYAKRLNDTLNTAFSLLNPSEQTRLEPEYIKRFTDASALAEERLTAAEEVQRTLFASLPGDIRKAIDDAMSKAVEAIQIAVKGGVHVDIRAPAGYEVGVT